MSGDHIPQGKPADGVCAVDAEPTLLIAEVSSRPTLIRCMGRSYRASAQGETVVFHDVTDITRPIVLGTARRADSDSEMWDIATARGHRLPSGTELLPVLVALRHAYWP